ncbi:PH domain-containing protein [Clostridium aminobutyricum]|uniref:PH domain-containing protein n=1 Tax=Clostridium aminobutyricum TaxID=33953 RepID=A0A939DBF7_CLOAM|nr:PH domain-containing protein [Clostridium aminobutyricum]MBN7774183.1 PH domain-containing protein [Clostridium aminobutyricum]
MESEFKQLNKKAIGCMRLSSGIGTIIFLLFCSIPKVIVYFLDKSLPTWTDFAYVIVISISVVWVIVAPIIRYKRYKYYIDDERLIVVEGLWFITKDLAPIERVHQIAITRGPIDRIYGLSKVIATTAGGNIVIRFLENHIAEEIAENLGIKIGTIVKDQKQRGDEDARS